MSAGQILVVLGVALVTFTAVAVLRRVGIPAPVVLVVAGLVIGFLPFVPDVSLQPDLVLLGLLPLLVFDTALTSSPTAFRRDWRSIGTLAVLLVVVTAAAVAAVAHWVAHLSWAMSFVLGTAVGPTDAAAASSVARRLRLPRRLVTLLEGEALFNDATALVFYAAAVTAATSGTFSAAGTVADVLYAVVVGTAIGLVVGLAGRWMLNRIDDPPIEIAGSILLAYLSYLPAQEAHASGVLAAVAAGLYLGWHRSGGAASARSRLQFRAFWETLVFLVNAALFILVGLSFHTFSEQARSPLGRLTLAAVAVVATVIVVRMVWMVFFAPPVGLRLRRRQRGPGSRLGERVILGWSGMRGAITLAALLAVPIVTKAGAPLAGRDDIIYLGFAVIVATLVGQGMTLPLLVRRVGLTEASALVEAERQARMELAQRALDRIGEATENGEIPDDVADGLRAQYLGRLHLLETAPSEEAAETTARASAVSEAVLRRDIIAAQRAALTSMRSGGSIGATTLRSIEHDLDLEEARLPDVPRA
ncbi:MAG TPA: Na+/H+ antiporter [Acidimicrobiales bacterium]|nr:Na+/H+ antiporter [Acidimicrobiales bacterium]